MNAEADLQNKYKSEEVNYSEHMNLMMPIFLANSPGNFSCSSICFLASSLFYLFWRSASAFNQIFRLKSLVYNYIRSLFICTLSFAFTWLLLSFTTSRFVLRVIKLELKFYSWTVRSLFSRLDEYTVMLFDIVILLFQFS